MNRENLGATAGSCVRALAVRALVLVAAAWPAADPVAGQAPATDIYLAELTVAEGAVTVGAWSNVTDRDGYDNQPSFEPGTQSILYTSMRDGQTDTYRYDLAAQLSERVTRTPESEYSPTHMPGTDRFSAVRVEADSTQRLWSFALDGSDARLLLPDVAPVGYHAWAGPERVALFVLGSPPALRLAHVGPGPGQQRAENIGRSLHRVPGRAAVSFLVKGDEWWIQVLDLELDRIERIAPALEGSEDYAWHPNGFLLMARESRLYSLDPAAGGDWVLIADLANEGIQGITRIAVSPDGRHVALVGARPGD
jgi:hypothetical protein